MLLDSIVDNAHETITNNIELAEKLDLVIRGMFTLTAPEYKVMYAVLSGVEITDYAKSAGKTRRNCAMLFSSGLKKLQRYVAEVRKEQDI